MSKEDFKLFAKSHPELANFVMNGTTSWQKFYELYDIYGSTSTVWNDYFKTTTSSKSLEDLFTNFKNIDMKSVQSGINNIQKTIGLLQDMGVTNTATTPKTSYEERPMYKYFED